MKRCWLHQVLLNKYIKVVIMPSRIWYNVKISMFKITRGCQKRNKDHWVNSCFPEQYCQTQQFIGIYFSFCGTYEHGWISKLSLTNKDTSPRRLSIFARVNWRCLKRSEKATVHKHNLMVKGILLRLRLCRVSATIYGLAFLETHYSKFKTSGHLNQETFPRAIIQVKRSSLRKWHRL